MAYIITERSHNTKTGPIMVTTSPQQSCPSICPLKMKDGESGGCYANAGPLRRIWDGLSTTVTGSTFVNGRGTVKVRGLDTLLQTIMRQHKALWRHNQAGDLDHKGGRIINGVLSAIAKANKAAKARGFTYTHHAVLGSTPIAAHNRGSIQGANDLGFTVNLSGNNALHADKLAALDVAPVVCMVPRDFPEVGTTPKGRVIKVCPAQLDEHTTCYNCGACALRDRDYIIGFRAHGNGVKKAEAIAHVPKARPVQVDSLPNHRNTRRQPAHTAQI